jgi:hypothetical protein
MKYLQQGYVVYTTWHMNLPEYYDQRQSVGQIIKNIILFKKNFFRFDYRKNWHYVDLRTFEDGKGIIDTEALATFLATRTDCIFMLDEGQDVFDSHKKSGAIARQSITRTRHMHKTLIIISQRAQAVDVTARGNVTWFYKCEKIQFPFCPAFFRVRCTDEIDENSNYPLWVRHDSQGDITWRAPVWHSGFAKKEIYNAYDSWYMRQNMIRSQDLDIEAFTLSLKDKFKALFAKKDTPRLIARGENAVSMHVAIQKPVVELPDGKDVNIQLPQGKIPVRRKARQAQARPKDKDTKEEKRRIPVLSQ